MSTITIPGRLIEFFQGGQAYADWEHAHRPDHAVKGLEFDEDEAQLFTAVHCTPRRRAGRYGYYHKVQATKPVLEALAYWAETLEGISNQPFGDPAQATDLRAARAVLDRIRKV